MDDKHTKGTETSLTTEGSFLSEREIREMGAAPEIDYPMPGEVAHPEGHEDLTLKQIEDNESGDAAGTENGGAGE